MKSTRATSTTARMIAFCLAFLLVATSLPATATIAAEGAPTGGTVVSIATATDLITVDQGTALESLGLPETLAATAILTGDTSNTAVDVTLPVTWTSSPAYDADEPGEYLFTGALGSEWMLGGGAVLPEIRVAVDAAGDAEIDPEAVVGLDGGISLLAGKPDEFNNYYNTLTLYNFTPGTLEARVRAAVAHFKLDTMVLISNINKFSKIEGLTIHGTTLNDKDFAFMRVLAAKHFDLRNLSALTEIPDGALKDHTNTGNVYLSSKVKKIGKEAFMNNNGTGRYATMPLSINGATGITEIGDRAFYGCRGFSSVVFGDANVTIGTEAFYGCAQKEMDFSKVISIGEGAFDDCAELKIKNGTFNNAITSIRPRTFVNCRSIQSLDLSNIVYIGAGAFWNCTNLTIPSGRLNPAITVIQDYAFANCASLEALDLSDVTSVGMAAFQDCKKLKNVGSLAKMTSIGASAFFTCPIQGGVDLSRAEKIGYSAFFACGDNFFIKPGTKIGVPGVILEYRAFGENKNIGTLDLSNVSSFGGALFTGIPVLNIKPGTKLGMPGTVIERDGFTKIGQINNLDLSNISTIGSGAFRDGKLYLSPGSTLGKKGIGISQETFYGATIYTDAQGLDLSTIKSFGQSAFEKATLSTIKANGQIGSLGAAIGKKAFSGATGLRRVDLSYTGTIGESAFEGSDISFTMGSKVGLPGVTIGANAFKTCGRIFEADLSNVSRLGNYAFADCTAMWLAEGTTLGQQGLKIGDSAFAGATTLDTADLTNVVAIGASAFEGCDALGEVDLTEVESIGSKAFRNCTNLEIINGEFTNPSLKINGEAVFENCTKLGALYLPANNKRLGDRVFAGCKNAEINLEHNGVVAITMSTFDKSSKITVRVPAEQLSAYEDNDNWYYAIARQKVKLLGITIDGGIIDPPPPKDPEDKDKDKNSNNNSYGGGATLGSAGTSKDKPAEEPADKPADKPAEKPEPTPQEKTELLSFTIGADNYVYDGKTTAANANLGSAYLDSEGNAMLPLRAIAELMGYDVDWSPEAKQITIALPDGKSVVLNVGASEVYQNGRIIGQLTDASGKTITPTIKDGRAYLPVRAFFVEVLGMDASDVQYDAKTQTINILGLPTQAQTA